jgi:type I restriction enzyme S subunit
MAEWRCRTIGDLCNAGVVELQTGPFGSQLHAHDYVEDGVPVVPTEAIRDRQIDQSVLPKIRHAKAEELRRHRLKPGDILFARRGVQATGHIGYVREAEHGFLCGTGAIRLRVNDGNSEITPDFLSHVLANPESVKWFKFHAIGATMPNLNEGIIRSFPLSIPPLAEQRAIAHILGKLDDKIELNRRMNETLEAMGRALFQSWFVDFDPVRAKMEGRPSTSSGQAIPGLPREIADLFPGRFEESELGEIPAGWSVKPLGELLELAYGKAMKADSRQQGTVPVYGSNGRIGWHDERLVAGPGIVVGRKGNPGTVTWSPTDFFPIDTTFYVIPKRSCHSLYFLFHSLRTHDLASLGADSAVPGLNRNLAYMNKQVVPDEPILAKFDAQVSALFQRLHQNGEESRTLAALRDTLLPKLISGELRVKDGAHIVLEVTV